MWLGESQLDGRSRGRDGRVCVANNVSRHSSQLRTFERQLEAFGRTVALFRSLDGFIFVGQRSR